MELYLNCSSDFSIQDETGKKYSIDEAKELVAKGKVDDCNSGFQRLINNAFDLEAVKQFYIDNP